MNKKQIIIILLIGILIIIGIVLVILKNNKSKQILVTNIGSNSNINEKIINILPSEIFEWDKYTKINNSDDKWLGTGDCGQGEFSSFLSVAQAGEIYKAVLPGGLEVLFTPNYYNWDYDTFIDFNNDDNAICGAGGRYPFTVIEDKLIWISSCGSGANYTEIIELCEESKNEIQNIITNMDTGVVDYNNSTWGVELKYPNTWELTENNSEDGLEVVQLVRPDPDYPNSAHGGQDPNSAEVFVSFYPNNGMAFDDRVDSLIPSKNILISEENLELDGLTAKRIDDEGTLGPSIKLFIEYDDQNILLIGGYYGAGEEQII